MNPPDRLWDLLDRLHHKTGKQVAVLVDEYDKPVLDVLGDPERAKANRDQLRGFYGVIKGCAHLVRFVFVTGINMFSKVSLFSGLNNLRNISLDPRCPNAVLCIAKKVDIWFKLLGNATGEASCSRNATQRRRREFQRPFRKPGTSSQLRHPNPSLRRTPASGPASVCPAR